MVFPVVRSEKSTLKLHDLECTLSSRVTFLKFAAVFSSKIEFLSKIYFDVAQLSPGRPRRQERI